MSKTADVDIFTLLQKHFGEEEAQKFVSLLNDKQEEGKDNIESLKDVFLTKQDKIDLISRMDSHFKWLARIVIVGLSLVVADIKLTTH